MPVCTADKMTRFEDLPLDLLPQFLVYLLLPDYIATLCLVSRTFYSFSVQNLYRRIVILPWHKYSKSRVCGLIYSNREKEIEKENSLARPSWR
jgi:hypothetical protein